MSSLIFSTGDDDAQIPKPDEPIFVLRARDFLAPEALEKYIDLVMHRLSDPGFVEVLKDQVKKMRDWQSVNGSEIFGVGHCPHDVAVGAGVIPPQTEGERGSRQDSRDPRVPPQRLVVEGEDQAGMVDDQLEIIREPLTPAGEALVGGQPQDAGNPPAKATAPLLPSEVAKKKQEKKDASSAKGKVPPAVPQTGELPKA